MYVRSVTRRQIASFYRGSLRARGEMCKERLALARYIDQGDFARHVRASRTEYMRRRDLLLTELGRALDDKPAVSGDNAGFQFVLRLPEGSDESRIAETLARQGVFVEGLKEFSRTRRMAPAILVGYANLSCERLYCASPHTLTRCCCAGT